MVETQLADDASVRRPPPRGQRAVGTPAPEGITRNREGGPSSRARSRGARTSSSRARSTGRIELPHHVLTVGPTGRVKAELSAKTVVVLGQVSGSIAAELGFVCGRGRKILP